MGAASCKVDGLCQPFLHQQQHSHHLSQQCTVLCPLRLTLIPGSTATLMQPLTYAVRVIARLGNHLKPAIVCGMIAAAMLRRSMNATKMRTRPHSTKLSSSSGHACDSS